MNKKILHLSSSTLRQFVTMGVALWSTPLLLRYIGKENFGAFKSIFDFVGLLNILEAGLYGGILGHMLKAQGQNNQPLLADIAHQALKKFLKITVIIIVLGSLLIPLYLKSGHMETISRGQLISTYLIVLFSYIFIAGNIHRGYLEVQHKGYIANIFTLIQALATTFIALILGKWQLGLISQGIAHFGGLMLGNTFLFLKGKSIWRLPRNPEVRANINQTHFYATLNETANKLSNHLDHFIIGSMLSFGQATIFFAIGRLFQIMTTQLQQISNASWPSIGQLFHQQKIDQFKIAVLEMTRRIAVASCVMGGVLYCANPKFVQWWLGEEYIGSKLFHASLAFNMFFLSTFTLWGWCFVATQKQKDLLPLKIVQGVGNLGMSLLFTKYIGIEGPIIGSVMSSLIISQYGFSFLLKRKFDLSRWGLLKSVYIPLIFNFLIIAVIDQFASPLMTGWSFVTIALVVGTLLFMLNGPLFLRSDLQKAANLIFNRR